MKKLAAMAWLLGSAANPQQPVPAVDPGLKTVVQVAIVCRDIEITSRRWSALLGVNPPEIRITKPGSQVKMRYRGKPSDGQAKLAFLKAGQVTIELIQPVGEGTSWREFLDARGEGVQHVAFQVTDESRAAAQFAGMGARTIHEGRYDGDNGSYRYVDSQAALGVVVELLHSDAKK